MANQTELLNVSNEMKLNDKRQIVEGQVHDEEYNSSVVSDEEEHNPSPHSSPSKLCLSSSNFISSLTFNSSV